VTSTGTLLDLDIILWPVHDRDGVIVGACAIARDIAEHKRAKQEVTKLYEQQRHVALTLQHALMGSPRDVPGMQTASRYYPATQGAGVGGDWFDLIPIGAGRIGVQIGDVMGVGVDHQIAAGDQLIRQVPGHRVERMHILLGRHAGAGEGVGGRTARCRRSLSRVRCPATDQWSDPIGTARGGRGGQYAESRPCCGKTARRVARIA